jgi:hypothetical protein
MFRRRVAVLLLLGLAACSGDKGPPSGPSRAQPGVLTLRLVTPHVDDAALLLALSGPGPVSAVSAPAGAAYVMHARSTEAITRIAVFGALASGDVVRFSVPDVNRVASYQATVLEVADRTNALRGSTQGYTLSVVR